MATPAKTSAPPPLEFGRSLSPGEGAYAIAQEKGIQWMWADAELASLPGLRTLARANPLRWSAPCSWEDLLHIFTHDWPHTQRPVRLRFHTSTGSFSSPEFASTQEVVAWISASREVFTSSHRLMFDSSHRLIGCSDLKDAERSRDAGVALVPKKALALEAAPYPSYWTNTSASESFKDTVLMPPESLPNFQSLFDQTYARVSTRDRPCPREPPCSQEGRPGGCPCSRYRGNPGLPVRYQVCQVLRLEDSKCWSEYTRHRQSIKRLRTSDIASKWPCEPPDTSVTVEPASNIFAPLESSSNEMYLLHGTNTRSALKIASEDVRLNLSKSGGALGPGLYLSESVTKSDEYACDTLSGTAHGTRDPYYEGIFAMLVMRVTMGKVHQTTEFFSDPEKAAVMNALRDQQYDSVLGDRRRSRGTYREFCVFKKEQIYSEYVVFYRRIYYADTVGAVPRPMSADAGGRLREGSFQFQVPSYWMNFHKNPHTEAFYEEHPVRPRGVALLQHTLQLLSGSKDLRVRGATRLEHSSMLCEYVALKLGIRTRGVKRSAVSMKAVFADAVQANAFSAAASKVAFSLENIDGDINETFLWCALHPQANGEVRRIGEIANVVREMRLLCVNPWVALKAVPTCRDGCKVLCLCRVVCGEIAGTPGTHIQDSKCHVDENGCRYFEPADHRQTYPEMMVLVDGEA